MAAAPTGVACPVYPWPSDAAQRGAKVFMQSDCAACHSALPYAGLRDAAVLGEVVGAKTAEILVAEEARPAGTTTPLLGGAAAQTLDLATVVMRVSAQARRHLASATANKIRHCSEQIQGGLRCNLYSTGTAAPVRAMLADGAAACQELKKSPVWLQFAQAFQAA